MSSTETQKCSKQPRRAPQAMSRIPRDDIRTLLSMLKGTVGLYIEDVTSGEVFEVNADHAFPAASVIKLTMLALLLRDVEEGSVDWTAPRKIAPQNRVGGTGVLGELDDTYNPTLKAMAKLMIVVSDNTATNEIMDVIGIERHNEFCRSLGFKSTKLMRKMMDYDAIKEGRNNFMCAGEAGKLLSNIAKGEFVSKPISEQIISIMQRQQCRNKLPALIPAIPYYYAPTEAVNVQKPNTVLVANKTGELARIQHDVGLFTLPDGRRYVVSVFTSDLEDDSQGIAAIGELSRVVYEALK